MKKTKVESSYVFFSDHKPVVVSCKLSLHQTRKEKPSPKLDWSTVCTNDDMAADYQAKVITLSKVSDSYTQFAANLNTAALSTLPKISPSLKISPWNNAELDKERMNIVLARRQGDHIQKKTASEELARKDVAFQKSYIAQCVGEIETASDNFKTRMAYKIVNQITGRKSSPSVSLSACSPTHRLAQWGKYFNELLGGARSDDTDDWEPTIIFNNKLDIEEGKCTIEELNVVLNQMKNNKASGYDAVTAEALKLPAIPGLFLKFIKEVLAGQSAYPEWKKNIIIPLPKKGDLTQYSNYRGISLMSIAGKVYNCLLLLRIR